MKDVKGLQGKALDEKLTELKKELLKINAQRAVGTAIKNPGQIKRIRKSMAHIYTIQQKKQTEILKGKQEKSPA